MEKNPFPLRMWAMTHASRLTALDGAVCAIGGTQQQQQEEEEGGEDTDGKGDKPDKPAVLYDKVGFVSGLAAGAVDTVVNYIPYGLHYRRQRGEILHPVKNPRIYMPRELYRLQHHHPGDVYRRWLLVVSDAAPPVVGVRRHVRRRYVRRRCHLGADEQRHHQPATVRTVDGGRGA
jgi:hypothetical protein